MRHVPAKSEGHENYFTISEEIISDDLDELKSKANEICHCMGVSSSIWVSRYAVMGKNLAKLNTEWLMILENGDVFSIEE